MSDSNGVPKSCYPEEMFRQIIRFGFLDSYFEGDTSEGFSHCCHIDD